MLRKLMKHEILASFRTYVPILLAVVAMTGMAILGFQVDDSHLIGLFSLSITMLIMGAAGGFTIYNLIVSLGTRVYGKPGYLLFSVPAKTWEILLAKLLINLMWLLATAVVCAGSFLFMFQILGEIMDVNILETLVYAFETVAPIDWIQLGIGSLVSVIYQIAFFMFLFALLNLIYKGEKKVLMGILLYFGLNQITSVIQNAAFGGNLYSYLLDGGTVSMVTTFWGTIALNGALTLILLGLTYYMMDKKMELQ